MFHKWPVGKVRRIGFRLSHMHITAGASLHWRVHNSNKSSALIPCDRWISRVEQTEARRDLLTPLQRSGDHVHSTPTPLSTLITINSWHLPCWLPCVCHRLFTGRYLFLSLRLSHVRSFINPHQLTHSESSGEPLLCSHILLTFYRLFTTGTKAEKVHRNCYGSHLDILCTHAPPPGRCGVQCMSKSRYTVCACASHFVVDARLILEGQKHALVAHIIPTYFQYDAGKMT